MFLLFLFFKHIYTVFDHFYLSFLVHQVNNKKIKFYSYFLYIFVSVNI